MPITLWDWEERMSTVSETLGPMCVIVRALGRPELLRPIVACFRVMDAVNDAVMTGEPLAEKPAVKATPEMMAEIRERVERSVGK